MKQALLLASLALTLLPSEPRDAEPKPVLPSSLQLRRELELPVREDKIVDPAEPQKEARKTFAQLMAEHAFKCLIL